jgi:hypothetical protein
VDDLRHYLKWSKITSRQGEDFWVRPLYKYYPNEHHYDYFTGMHLLNGTDILPLEGYFKFTSIAMKGDGLTEIWFKFTNTGERYPHVEFYDIEYYDENPNMVEEFTEVF